MVEKVEKRRQSRGNAATSYRVSEAYDFLDSDDENARQKEAKSNHTAQDDEEDSDTFMPDEQEEEEEELVSEEGDEDEEMYDAVGLSPAGSVAATDIDDSELGTPSPLGNKRRRSMKSAIGSISTAAAAGLYKGRKKQTTSRASTTPRLSTTPKTPTRRPPQKENQARKMLTRPKDMPMRGVDEWGRGVRGGGLENRVKDLFGPCREDLEPILKTKEFWGHQHTLPRRQDGLTRSFYVSDEAREREMQKLRTWFWESGHECFLRGQKDKLLPEEEGQRYLDNGNADSANVLMGAATDPKLYPLKKRAFIDTATPFESKENRHGFVLSLGSRVKDTQWALNEKGATQYLAVAVDQDPRQFERLQNPQAPAFSPTAQFPSSIQIWAFDGTDDGILDITQQPRLELVICTEWGAPKQLRWCPFAVEESCKTRLGLLASMWSDGRVRILDVAYPNTHLDGPQTIYRLYTRCAFEIELPGTVPSGIHWLSGTSIAVSTAAGMVGAWTLTRTDAFPPEGHDMKQHYNPDPWFYRQVADTFILSLSSGFPSRPTYISITTADGYSKLIDLRSPNADTAETGRGRIFGLTQAWHEHTQSFLMPDEIQLLRSNTIRRYYSNIHHMRSDAQIVCVATSPVHPGVLIGSADGYVTASNPIARILNYKEIPWQQIWFTHEWRPPVEELPLRVRGLEVEAEEENIDDEDGNSETPHPGKAAKSGPFDPSRQPKVPPEVLAQPLSRLTEGYRVQQTTLQPVKPGADPYTKDFIKPITIHEEPTCITAVAWNPNLLFGTWAVAGMGDGLLRVEDLGI